MTGVAQLVSKLTLWRVLHCRPLAARGSVLYFTLVQLRQLDPMYCFSLNVRYSCSWCRAVLVDVAISTVWSSH